MQCVMNYDGRLPNKERSETNKKRSQDKETQGKGDRAMSRRGQELEKIQRMERSLKMNRPPCVRRSKF